MRTGVAFPQILPLGRRHGLFCLSGIAFPFYISEVHPEMTAERVEAAPFPFRLAFAECSR
jgi:hypothetical protein